MLPFSLRQIGLIACMALLWSVPSSAEAADYDSQSAVIFTYFAIGNDDSPSASITGEQFNQQIEELTSGVYNIVSLEKIVDAFASGRTLPARTIALTFDGADQSILDKALPLLKEHDLPFTVFVPADRVGVNKSPYLTWDNLRKLKRTGLVTFGLHPSAYATLDDASESEIKRQINNSLVAIRKELDVNPTLLAYPYGEYNAAARKIARDMGFKAAFGQQSGVAWAGDDRYALPRFTLTERYGDMDRFLMTANALPLPATDISPTDPHLSSLSPAIGFTVPDALTKSLKSMTCFSSSDEKPKLVVMGNRVELRMEKPFMEDRPRVNCTMPVAGAAGEDPRWRWFGMLYTVPQELLDAASQKENGVQKHAADTSDNISIE